MRITIILISLLSLASCVRNNNKMRTWVYDQEDVFTIKQERSLDSIISDYEKRTKNQILIVTSKDMDDYEEPILYAANFGNIHGVGQKGKDNGLVIFVSKNLKQTCLATGYGTEKALKDEICKDIIDSCMIPFFKEERYFDGIKAGLEESIRKWQ